MNKLVSQKINFSRFSIGWTAQFTSLSTVNVLDDLGLPKLDILTKNLQSECIQLLQGDIVRNIQKPHL